MVNITNINNTPSSTARKYLALVLLINDIKISKRELDLLTFVALQGNISTGGKKEEFIQQYSTSKATIGNLIYSLKKKGLLKRIDGKTCLHPSFKILPEMEINVKLKG